MSQESATSLFSDDLHEMGSRIVDLLNQTSFLYKFPGVSGVTLACIVQHLEPMRNLLDSSRTERQAFGRVQSSDGYTVGQFTCPDPLGAAFEYAQTGFGVFVRHLNRVISANPEASATDRLAIEQICDASQPAAAEFILQHKNLIESQSEEVTRAAKVEFEPLGEEDWQGQRMVLFFFMLELQKERRSRR